MAANNQNQRGGASSQHREAGKMGADARTTRESTQSSTQGRSGTSNRGFASMNPEEQRRIASMGGKASHQSGRGHEWTSQEAREAGRKGGQASSQGNRSRGGSQ